MLSIQVYTLPGGYIGQCIFMYKTYKTDLNYVGTIFMNFPQPGAEPAVYQYSWAGRYMGVDVSSGYTSFVPTRG
jgi:hypothetical protein